MWRASPEVHDSNAAGISATSLARIEAMHETTKNNDPDIDPNSSE